MTEKEKNEKKKEYLNRYKNAVRKYESLQEQEQQLRLEMDHERLNIQICRKHITNQIYPITLFDLIRS